jgi:hypothetical protein
MSPAFKSCSKDHVREELQEVTPGVHVKVNVEEIPASKKSSKHESPPDTSLFSCNRDIYSQQRWILTVVVSATRDTPQPHDPCDKICAHASIVSQLSC